MLENCIPVFGTDGQIYGNGGVAAIYGGSCPCVASSCCESGIKEGVSGSFADGGVEGDVVDVVYGEV